MKRLINLTKSLRSSLTLVSIYALLVMTSMILMANNCSGYKQTSISDKLNTYYEDQLVLTRQQFDLYCDSVCISNNLRDWHATVFIDHETREEVIVLIYITGDSLCTQLYTNRLEINQDTLFLINKKQSCR